jgi:hypothetical protein
MRNFRQLFINSTTAQKTVYMPMELILNKKCYVSSSCVLDFKKISSNTLDRTVREVLHLINQLHDGRPIGPALAAYSLSAAQGVPCIFWSLKVHHHRHKRPAFNPSPLHMRQ